MSSTLNYLIVHGSYGSPEGNWFSWLKACLEKEGARVFVPRFPTPDGQSLEAWESVAAPLLANCDHDRTVLIGHSTGSIFVLRLAEKALLPFRAVFSVCPFAEDLGLKDFDPLNASFIRPEMDWDKVRRGTKKLTCFAGDNDPYVPLVCSERVAQQIHAPLIVVSGGGHLNREAGFQEFPLLLNKIRQ